MAAKQGLEAWIKAHGWAIMAAAFALYGGFVTGQTTTEARLTRLEEIVTANATSLNARREFMVCAIRNLDQLQDELDLTPPCAMEVKE